MRGLLLKDLYMMKHYCRTYLLIAAVFLAASFFADGNMFLIFYPCLLCGVIPVNLLSYDERSRFLQYSAALPYTKSQIVSSKYLIGLMTQAAVMLMTGIAQGIKMSIEGVFSVGEFLPLMLALLIISTLASSIPLPFIFKYGTEKGRIAYYVMIGFVCAASVVFSELFQGQIGTGIPSGALFGLLTAVGICVYAGSWYLSVVFFNKREL